MRSLPRFKRAKVNSINNLHSLLYLSPELISPAFRY